MKSLSKIMLQTLPQTDTPCISLYMPTHRKNPENKQDPIRFKNMLTELEKSLSLKYSKREYLPLLEPYEKLLKDSPFWNTTLDGLAIISSPTFFQIFTLPMSMPELCVVADNFYLKPLRKYLQTIDRYQVLAITQNKVQLFEGNQHGLHEVSLDASIPHTLHEALGDEVRGRHLTVASYGGVGPGKGPMRHGHGSKKDETEIDIEHFLRIVSKEIHEHYSKPTQLPLILAAVQEYHPIFHKVSDNPFLVSRGIEKNPESLSTDTLTQLSWDILNHDYTKKIDDLRQEFSEHFSKKTGTDSLEDIAKKAVEGAVNVLYIEANKQVPGKINPQTGAIEAGDLIDPETNDLLEDIAQIVEHHKGTVIVLSTNAMPTNTGIAAIFRY